MEAQPIPQCTTPCDPLGFRFLPERMLAPHEAFEGVYGLFESDTLQRIADQLAGKHIAAPMQVSAKSLTTIVYALYHTPPAPVTSCVRIHAVANTRDCGMDLNSTMFPQPSGNIMMCCSSTVPCLII